MSNLHGDIMNIQVDKSKVSTDNINSDLAYKFGHRDARHAAAELAIPVDSTIAQIREALERYRSGNIPQFAASLAFVADIESILKEQQ